MRQATKYPGFLVELLVLTKRQVGSKLKSLGPDGDGEYVCTTFSRFLNGRKDSSIETFVYTSQQEGTTRKRDVHFLNRYIKCAIVNHLQRIFGTTSRHCLLHWNRITGYCLHSNYTPYQLGLAPKPDINQLRICGCLCLRHVKDKEWKLGNGGKPAISIASLKIGRLKMCEI